MHNIDRDATALKLNLDDAADGVILSRIDFHGNINKNAVTFRQGCEDKIQKYNTGITRIHIFFRRKILQVFEIFSTKLYIVFFFLFPHSSRTRENGVLILLILRAIRAEINF